MLYKRFAVAALCVASGAAQAVSDVDLAAIRSQIEEMRQSYEQRISALEEKLRQAEAARPGHSAPELLPKSTAAAVPGSFNPEVSLILQGQYRNMKDVPGRNIAGFAPASASAANTRGFSVDETELILAANVDPFWRAQTVIAMADGQANVEEAWAQSLAIGHGLGLKIGRFRSGVGYLNEQHPHQRDFTDAPLMYRAMFGDSYVQDGGQLKWLAPTPVFLELGAEWGRGANFPGTNRNKNGSGGGALFAHAGDDLGVAHSWRAGISWLQTAAREREASFVDVGGAALTGAFTGSSTTWLADFVWKWSPNGNPRDENFKFQGEYFRRQERGDLTCTSVDPAHSCALPQRSDYLTRQHGWYVLGVYQFTPAWRVGVRQDQLDSGERDWGGNAGDGMPGRFRPKKTSAMVDYSWSEFARIRLQYAEDQSMPGLRDHQLSLQYIMSLGAHGAHKF